MHLRLDLPDLLQRNIMWIDFVSDVVAMLSFDLNPRSRQNFLVLKISSFLEVIFAILLANVSNSGV